MQSVQVLHSHPYHHLVSFSQLPGCRRSSTCSYRLDVSLISEVLQSGGYWSSSGSSFMYAPDDQVKCDGAFSYEVTMESQSPLKRSPSKRVGFLFTVNTRDTYMFFFEARVF